MLGPENETPEARKQRIETWVKYGIAGGICLAVSPIIFSVVQGMVGLVVAGAIGFTALQLTPVFAMKVANWRMKLIIAEAEKNPIETMKNVYLEKSRIIQEKDRKIVEFEGRLGDYHDKMTGFAKRYPDEAARFQTVEQKMESALKSMKRKQLAAKQVQAEYKEQIAKADAIYAMACAAHEVTELAGNIEAQVFMEIKQQVSFDAVNHKFNTAVAALSLEVDNEEAFSLPENSANVTSILTAQALPENIPVRRMR